MTVSELIEELKKYDGGMKVVVGTDGGQGCGDPELVETTVGWDDEKRYWCHDTWSGKQVPVLMLLAE